MKIYKNKWFARFANAEGIDDEVLCAAVRSAESGLIDANLGGNVIKQRLARDGQGKRGGFRSIILFKKNERSFFVYGFAKSDRDNIQKNELKAFRMLAEAMLNLTDEQIEMALNNATIIEVVCDD